MTCLEWLAYDNDDPAITDLERHINHNCPDARPCNALGCTRATSEACMDCWNQEADLVDKSRIPVRYLLSVFEADTRELKVIDVTDI